MERWDGILTNPTDGRERKRARVLEIYRQRHIHPEPAHFLSHTYTYTHTTDIMYTQGCMAERYTYTYTSIYQHLAFSRVSHALFVQVIYIACLSHLHRKVNTM